MTDGSLKNYFFKAVFIVGAGKAMMNKTNTVLLLMRLPFIGDVCGHIKTYTHQIMPNATDKRKQGKVNS